MSTTPDTRQIPDSVLQAAINEALTQSSEAHLNTIKSTDDWNEQAPARLALARAFQASLPEPTPPTADGKTPGQVDYEAFVPREPGDWESCVCKQNYERSASAVLAAFGGQANLEAERLRFSRMGAQQGLEEARRAIRKLERQLEDTQEAAIARMEAVPWREMDKAWDDSVSESTPNAKLEYCFEAVRNRLIAAAKEGQAPIQTIGINGLTAVETEQTASVAGLSQPAEIPWTEWRGGECPLKDEEVEEFELKFRNGLSCKGHPTPSSYYWSPEGASVDITAYRVLKWREGHGPEAVDWKAKYEESQAKLDYVHAMGLRFGMMTSSDKPEPYLAHTWEEDSDHERMFREWSESIGWQDWKARAEKAEAELARITFERNHAINAERSAHSNAKLPRLRPLALAGPVPDGAIRLTGFYSPAAENWCLGLHKSNKDTHFADIYPPEEVKPDPFAELKAAHAAGKVIQYNCGSKDKPEWEDLPLPAYEGKPHEYRIKPESTTFEARGKTWTRHTPGDPMPCEAHRRVDVITRKNLRENNWWSCPDKGNYWDWSTKTDVIGWIYADEPAQPWQPAVGDPVRLKSGGPAMTVGKIEADIDRITVFWTDSHGQPCSYGFFAACLTLAKEGQL